MGVEMQKPFTVEEIDQHPFAVVIAFLIGLVLILAGAIGVLWYDSQRSDDRCDERVEAKTQQIISVLIATRHERDYYRAESEGLDSLLKEKTRNNVEKILPEVQ